MLSIIYFTKNQIERNQAPDCKQHIPHPCRSQGSPKKLKDKVIEIYRNRASLDPAGVLINFTPVRFPEQGHIPCAEGFIPLIAIRPRPIGQSGRNICIDIYFLKQIQYSFFVYMYCFLLLFICLQFFY